MASALKTADKYFEKFATSTPIRAFNFIRTSSTLVERLFWTIILLVFTATSVWYVEIAIETFYSEPTASQITYAVNTTDGLRFDDALICLEVLSNKLVKLYDNFGDDVIKKVIAGDSRNFIEVLHEKLAKLHQTEDKRADWLTRTLSNLSTAEGPEGVLDQYHAFEEGNFAILTQNEVALLGLTTVMFSRLIDLETDPHVFFVEWQSAAIRNLYSAYVERNTNFSELFSLVVEMTCTLLQIRIIRSEYDLDTSLTKYIPYNLCRNQKSVRYFGTFGNTETICYPIAKNGESRLYFRNGFDNVVISIHSTPFYKQFAPDLKYISIDLEGALATEQGFIGGRFHYRQVVKFSLETQSLSANLRRRPCSAKETRNGSYEDCTFWCRLEALIQACDCMPLFGDFVPNFGWLPPTNQSCAITLGNNFVQWSTHEKCGAALTAKYDPRSLNCSRECLQNCEHLMFASTIEREDTNGTVLTLMATKFVYQSVIEYVTMDLEGCITALGGNLSLWLGASFLALIHIMVFFVKLPFEHYGAQSQRGEKKEVNQVDAQVGCNQQRSFLHRDVVIDLENHACCVHL